MEGVSAHVISVCSYCLTFLWNQRYEVALACEMEKTADTDVIDVDSSSNTMSILGNAIMRYV